MPAPAVAPTALAQTRTGRRIAIGLLTLLILSTALVLTPLLAIPFAITGSAATTLATAQPLIGPSVAGSWGYPLAGRYSKGRGFGHNPVIGCSYCSVDHKGYDMAQGCGATIFAAGPGTVITAGYYFGYGNSVRIDHGDGLITLYGHMLDGSLKVAKGDQVQAGTPIGLEGKTGKSFGCHLHYEITHHGVQIDPQPFMAARGLPLT